MTYGPQLLENLNRASIDNADGPDVFFPDKRRSTHIEGVSLEVHFDDLEARLCSEILKHRVVIGCVAWLTNVEVLRALATRESVGIVVNKEDFLRPDKGNWSQKRIRELYGALPGGDRYQFGLPYSYASDPSFDAIRCAGICADRRTVPPRMHHKFFVFGRMEITRIKYRKVFAQEPNATDRTFPHIEEVSREIVGGLPHGVELYANCPDETGEFLYCHGEYFSPEVVWTGSFNASENGTRSLENIVIVKNCEVARAYAAEWETIQGISEPLNWNSEYVHPEWRIGT